MPKPMPYNLTGPAQIVAGATYEITFRYMPGGVAQDLTLWTAQMDIRENIADVATLSTISTTPSAQGYITLNYGAVLGQIYCRIEAAQTITMITSTYKDRKFVWDLELIDPLGTEIPILEGCGVISGMVTR